MTTSADVRRFLALDRSGWVKRHRNGWHPYHLRSFVVSAIKSTMRTEPMGMRRGMMRPRMGRSS